MPSKASGRALRMAFMARSRSFLVASVLKQFWQRQSWQNTCLAKHSQYIFRHDEFLQLHRDASSSLLPLLLELLLPLLLLLAAVPAVPGRFGLATAVPPAPLPRLDGDSGDFRGDLGTGRPPPPLPPSPSSAPSPSPPLPLLPPLLPPPPSNRPASPVLSGVALRLRGVVDPLREPPAPRGVEVRDNALLLWWWLLRGGVVLPPPPLNTLPLPPLPERGAGESGGVR